MNSLTWQQRVAIEILAVTAPRLLAAQLVKPRAPHIAPVPPTADGARVAPIAFPTADNAACRGWLVAPQHGAPDSCIVLAHGWNSNALRLAAWVQPLLHQGHSVLLYHARGHGDSDPTPVCTLRQFAEDLDAAVLFAASTAPRVAVLGHSLGAAAAILTAAGARSEGRPQARSSLKATVAIAAPAHPVPATLDLLRSQGLPAEAILRRAGAYVEALMGCSFDDIAPVNHVHAVKAPVLIIHGTADPVVPPAHFYRLSEAASPAIETRVIPGADHESVLSSLETRAAVFEFLARHFPALP